MGQMTGADVEALRSVADQLDQAADELESSAHGLSGLLGGLNWLGDVAVRFSDVWHSSHSPSMGHTSTYIRAAATQLRANAVEQEAASAVDLSSIVRAFVGFSRPDLTLPWDLTPKDTEKWWTDLSPEDRLTLITEHPDAIGNLNGIPPADRYEANRLYMQQLLDAETSPDGPMHKLLAQFTDGSGHINSNRHIILFDPRGDGKVAEVFGDLSTAEHVAVVVPGLNSTLGNFGGVAGNAQALQAVSGAGTATIAWTGYDAPNYLTVASDASAKAGAGELINFVGAIQSGSNADVTVVGHSYGSLVVGEALKQGLHVENAVFIGSPGVGVDRVSDFPPGAANHYYAGTTPRDPVTVFERFGNSPVDKSFGATVFDAGGGHGVWALPHHSQYFDKGAGLDNLGHIVTGDSAPTLDRPNLAERALRSINDAVSFWN